MTPLLEPSPSSDTVGLLSWLSGLFIAIVSGIVTGAAFVSGTRARLAAHEMRISTLELNLREEVRRLADKIDENHRQTMAMLLEIRRG